MFTLDTRIDVTPLGQYVARLHRADRRLGNLVYPGLNSDHAGLQKSAEQAVVAANSLRGVLQDELDRFGGLRTSPGSDHDGYPADYDGPAPEWTAEQMEALDEYYNEQAEICPTCNDERMIETYGGRLDNCPTCVKDRN